MRIAIIGSRNFSNEVLFTETINSLPFEITEIISGGAKGADTLAANWANQHSIKLTVYKPDWAKYGKAAGVVRNKLIIEDCEYCLVFWDSKSYGTKFSIDYCNKLNKTIRIIAY